MFYQLISKLKKGCIRDGVNKELFQVLDIKNNDRNFLHIIKYMIKFNHTFLISNT